MEREIPEGEAGEGCRGGSIMDVWRAALPGAENQITNQIRLWLFRDKNTKYIQIGGGEAQPELSKVCELFCGSADRACKANHRSFPKWTLKPK